MDGKRNASASASAKDAIRIAHTAIAHSQRALAKARERVQETQALVRRLQAEREQDAGKDQLR